MCFTSYLSKILYKVIYPRTMQFQLNSYKYFGEQRGKKWAENSLKMTSRCSVIAPSSILRSRQEGFMHSETITKEPRFRPRVRTMTCHPCTYTSDKVMGLGLSQTTVTIPALSSHACIEICAPLYLWSIICLRLGLQPSGWVGELKLHAAADLVSSDGEKKRVQTNRGLWIMEYSSLRALCKLAWLHMHRPQHAQR